LEVADVTIRDLRHRGGEVVDRVAAGEPVTITRGGRPVAELRPVVGPVLSGEALLERWRHLPSVDPGRWRQDVDDVVDQGW
jgi:prevent-host-death family protein